MSQHRSGASARSALAALLAVSLAAPPAAAADGVLPYFRVLRGADQSRPATDTGTAIVSPPPATPVARDGTLSVAAAVPSPGRVGLNYVGRLKASRAATFAKSDGDLPPGVTLADDGSILGVPQAAGTFVSSYLVTAGDGGQQVLGPVTLKVLDAADPAAVDVTVLTDAVPTSGTVGVPYAGKLAAGNTASGVTTFAPSPSDTIPGVGTASDGTVSGVPTQAGDFPIAFTATSPDGRSSTSTTLVVSIRPKATLAISTDGLGRQAYTGKDYLGSLAGSGAPGLTFAKASGTLPPGTTLSPDGTLAGKPTQQGEFTATYAVTDGGQSVSSGPVTIVVQTDRSGITFSNQLAPQALVQQSYYGSVSARDANGQPIQAVRLQSGTLIDGLSYDPEYGTLQGTPTVAGRMTLTFQATDPVTFAQKTSDPVVVDVVPRQGTLAVNLQLNQSPVKLGRDIGGNFWVDTPGYAPSADQCWDDAGCKPLAFAVEAGGNPPPGLVIDQAAGTFSAPATRAGTYTFAIRAVSSPSSSLASPGGAAIAGDGSYGVSAQVQLVVRDPGPTMTWRIDASRAVRELQSGSFPIPAELWLYVDGGKGPYTFTNGAENDPWMTSQNRDWDEGYQQWTYGPRTPFFGESSGPPQYGEVTTAFCVQDSSTPQQQLCTTQRLAIVPYPMSMHVSAPTKATCDAGRGTIPFSLVADVAGATGDVVIQPTGTLSGTVVNWKSTPLGGGKYGITGELTSQYFTTYGNSTSVYPYVTASDQAGHQVSDFNADVLQVDVGNCGTAVLGEMTAQWYHDANDHYSSATDGLNILTVTNGFAPFTLVSPPETNPWCMTLVDNLQYETNNVGFYHYFTTPPHMCGGSYTLDVTIKDATGRTARVRPVTIDW